MSTSTITITRTERDEILDQLHEWTREGHDTIPFETREEATASLAALHRAFDLRDELHGWPDHSSPCPDTFTATVTPELVELLRRTVEEYTHSLGYDRTSFDRAKAGDRDHWPMGVGDLGAVVEYFENLIRSDEQTVGAINNVLARLDAEAVMA